MKVEFEEEVYNEKVYAIKSKFSEQTNLKEEIFAVIIIEEKTLDMLSIKNIVMSCRYMGFDIEAKLIQFIYKLAVAKQKKYIEGKYSKTERNGLIKDFYSAFNFSLVKEENNSKFYRCLISDLGRIIFLKEKYDIQKYLKDNISLEKQNHNVKKSIRELDNAIEIFIPSGGLHKGITAKDAKILSKTYGLYPEHEINGNVVQINSFWMDQYCITNFQYCVFLNKQYTCEERKKIIFELKKTPYFMIDFDSVTGKAICKEKNRNLPVVVNYDLAEAYAKWAGGRLPTEEEWEYAGKASDGRWFPWGMELPDYKKINMKKELVDVHHYYDSASPFEIVQLVGNVWQWCTGEFRGHHIYRGGDFRFDSAYWKRLQIRPLEAAENCGNLVGIRVVRDL